MTAVRQRTEYLDFKPGQAAELSGVRENVQRQWRQRGLLPPNEEGRYARFLPGEVLRMFIMRAFTDSNIGILNTRAFTTAAAATATAILRTLPGAVRIVADPALGPGFEARERARVAGYAETHRAYRYLVIPLPERADAPGRPAMWQRGDLSDLPDLMDDAAPMALTFDCEAIARAFMARVRRITDAPLETWTFTLDRGPTA